MGRSVSRISSFCLSQFVKSVFWDNRASNGALAGNNSGPVGNNSGLEGLGLGPLAETWHFDMGVAESGYQLVPINSIIQTLVFCDGPFLPTYDYLGMSASPIDCDVNNNNTCNCNLTAMTEQSPVIGEVKWGGTLSIQVQGMTQLLAGSNTFIVIPIGLPGGPIGDYTRVELLARRQLLAEEASFLSEYHARLVDPSIVPAEQPELHPTKDFWEADISHPYFVRPWVVLAAVAALSFLFQIGKYSRKTEGNIDVLTADLDFESQSTRKNRVGDKRKRDGGLFMSFVIALGFLKGAKADEGCTIDCIDDGIMIPNQDKYKTALFIPTVIDLRDKCGETLEMYMKEGLQDCGVKGWNNEQLKTPIYGYVLI
jgi:hypothetical protein